MALTRKFKDTVQERQPAIGNFGMHCSLKLLMSCLPEIII